MFKKIWNTVKSVFKKKNADQDFDKVHETAQVAIKMVNQLKDVVENPLTNTIVDLTPTKLDDKAVFAVKSFMVKSAEEMLLAENLIAAGSSPEEIIKAFVAYMQKKTKPARAKWWSELQGKLTVDLADGVISVGEAIGLGQLVYKGLFSN